MTSHALLAGLLGFVLACASGGAAGTERPQGATTDKSAIVLKGSDLSGNLLDAMRYRVPSMTVNPQPNDCPRIVFRGIRSLRNQANPTVYVDGTRLGDTCILQQLSASDVDYVEVYPSGNTTRTAYERNPFGLILIFRKQK